MAEEEKKEPQPVPAAAPAPTSTPQPAPAATPAPAETPAPQGTEAPKTGLKDSIGSLLGQGIIKLLIGLILVLFTTGVWAWSVFIAEESIYISMNGLVIFIIFPFLAGYLVLSYIFEKKS